MQLRGTSRINHLGHLEIGGCDTVQLAREFGTPLIVYDEALIRSQCRLFLSAFRETEVPFQVAYASKAFSSLAIYQLVQEEGLSVDVVSGGELYTALKAGFPPERIHFHGNNKLPEEIEMALEAGIGCFVIDNFHEIDLLRRLAEKHRKEANVLLRITPGVHPDTHGYIQTGQEDSKFGFDLESGMARRAIEKVLAFPRFRFLGFHFHIGSQIFEAEGFLLAIDKIVGLIEESGIGNLVSVLNVGGGFGIRYHGEEDPLPIPILIQQITARVKQRFAEIGCPVPEIWVEPGRSIVGEAGTTLYTVGSGKDLPGIRRYIAVDGGMSDNIRPALYQAKYEAMLANRALEERTTLYSVAGKLCETGDMLIWDVLLPETCPGDLLAVFCTGAYTYSMANNYNRLTRPAVVFVRDGEARLVIRRETYEDLIRNELPLPSRGMEKVAMRKAIND